MAAGAAGRKQDFLSQRIKRLDGQEEIPEYLKLDPELQPRGLEEMSPQDVASGILLDLDYDAQVMAIHLLLSRQRRADDELANEIKRMESHSSVRHGQWAVDQWVNLLHDSVYQSAAHSMAAVGMLAPLVESMFYEAFRRVREQLFPASSLQSSHLHWKLSGDDAWDCHFFYIKQGRHKNLVEGITQLAEAVGLSTYLPKDLKPTLQALFEYRNKMFHCGFEWPVDERKKFAKRIGDASTKGSEEERWSSSWFNKAESAGEPWVFYLTDAFVEHCLDRIDRIIEGVGAFAGEQLARHIR